MIDYDKFKKSLKHLELQFDNYNNSSTRTDLSELDREALAESVIQRFETCYDSLWKILKRYLMEELGIPEVPNSPKPIFRLGSESKLFSSTLEQWLQYSDARVDTAHDYSGEKAEECLKLMGDFIDDAIGLYQTMTGETWE
ncbi:MAG: nucleotidyltransferase [Deltaproteobacteria bacterium]|nr:nucleotidyltransferase [Deltaproteobacteria bacterium]